MWPLPAFVRLILYLQMLRPETPTLSRGMAMRMANLTALRQNPAVQQALRTMLETEKNESARNALRSVDQQVWMSDLREAVMKEPLASSLKDNQGQPNLTPQFVASFRYFSDYVAPELNRPQRMDEMSCIKCHGVPGRVPSMELVAPDGNGYWSVAKMLKNYLTLQQRVSLADVEQSKATSQAPQHPDGQGGRSSGRTPLSACRARISNHTAVGARPAASRAEPGCACRQ